MSVHMAPTNFDPAAYPIISQHWFGIGPFRPIGAERSITTITNNGPGIPAETVTDVLDFSMRVSSREAYVAPDRGAQEIAQLYDLPPGPEAA